MHAALQQAVFTPPLEGNEYVCACSLSKAAQAQSWQPTSLCKPERHIEAWACRCKVEQVIELGGMRDCVVWLQSW